MVQFLNFYTCNKIHDVKRINLCVISYVYCILLLSYLGMFTLIMYMYVFGDYAHCVGLMFGVFANSRLSFCF